MSKSSSSPAKTPAGNAQEPQVNPEWVGFFREAKRLAALARSRREAAQEHTEGSVQTGSEPSEGQNNG